MPFCARRCNYCDFATSALPADRAAAAGLMDAYVDAFEAELAASPPRPARSVYFGGGTPSQLGARRLLRLLAAIAGHGGLLPEAEITVEANPTSVEADLLEALRAGGFNRLSLGLQSLRDELLTVLTRTHTAAEALAAFGLARAAGFDNISVDLMFNLPRQRFTDWCDDLQRIIQLGPEHVSLYELSVEAGTPLAADVAAGRLLLPDEEVDAAMYEAARELLPAAGWEHYEISNFARPGRSSAHNAVYWRNEEYRGYGPGAASYVGRRRWTNEPRAELWRQAVTAGGAAVSEEETRSEDEERRETMYLGLRQLTGVDVAAYTARHGGPPEAWFGTELARLVEVGWLERTPRAWRLTADGLLWSNRVFMEFL